MVHREALVLADHPVFWITSGLAVIRHLGSDRTGIE